MLKQISKSILMFFVASTMFAISCNKEESNATNDPQGSRSREELIVGDWKCVNGNFGGGEIVKFSSEGKVYVDALDYGTYVISADMLGITHPWVHYPGQSQEEICYYIYRYSIIELSEKTLELQMTYSYSGASGYLPHHYTDGHVYEFSRI